MMTMTGDVSMCIEIIIVPCIVTCHYSWPCLDFYCVNSKGPSI